MRSFGAFVFVTALALLASSVSQEREALAQKQVAVAEHKVDLNGDGKIDELRIDDLGIISVLITGDQSAGAWTPLAAQGKIIGGSITVRKDVDPSGAPLILAVAKLRRSRTQTYEEAIALSYSPGKLTPLWRGPQGSDEADGALRRFVELGKHGLIRYASRHGVFRCDGKTAHLDANRYDFASKSFRPARQAIRIATDSPVLVAQGTAPAGISDSSRGNWFRPRGASSSLRASSTSRLVAPVAASDNNSKTAWVENKPGVGSGEFLTLQSGLGGLNVRALRFELGHGGVREGFRSPKRLGLLLGKEKVFWIDFPKTNAGDAFWVSLPEPVRASCVTLVIADTNTGKSQKRRAAGAQTAISEISIVSSEELDPLQAAQFLAKGIAAGRAKADTRRLLQSLPFSTASDALLAELKNTDNHRSKTRLRLALATIPAGAEALVGGLRDDSLKAKDYLVLSRALRKLGPAGLSSLTSALGQADLSRESSKRIAMILQTLPGQEAEIALLTAVGKGSSGQRKAILKALAGRPGAYPVIRDALAKATSDSERADLYLAAAAIAPEPDSEQHQAIAILLTEKLAAGNLSYEVHYRLLQSLGSIGGPLASNALLAQFDALATATEDFQKQALREVAAAALLRSDKSNRYSARILSDKSPGVRLAGLDVSTPEFIDIQAASQLLQTESWTGVRRSAVAILGASCHSSERFAALRLAATTDSDKTVAITALNALQRCETRGLFALLLSIVDADRRPLALRIHAARQLANVHNADSNAIAKRFRSAKARALSDRKSAKIAAALTVSLSVNPSPAVIAILEKSASDAAFPQLQAAALNALSETCPRSSRAIFRRLQESYEHSVAQAAKAAYRRCR